MSLCDIVGISDRLADHDQIPYLHNAIFKVNNFLESLPSFWIMRSQRSRRRDKGLYKECKHHTKRYVFCIEMDSFWKHVCMDSLKFLFMEMSTTQNSLKNSPEF